MGCSVVRVMPRAGSAPCPKGCPNSVAPGLISSSMALNPPSWGCVFGVIPNAALGSPVLPLLQLLAPSLCCWQRGSSEGTKSLCLGFIKRTQGKKGRWGAWSCTKSRTQN